MDIPQIKIPENLFAGFDFANKELNEAAKQLAEASTKIGRLLPNSLEVLSKHGWYVSDDSTIIETIILSIEATRGNPEKLNTALEKFYQKECASIIFRLKSKFEDRAEILDEALKAHKRKMFYASTCLFL